MPEWREGRREGGMKGKWKDKVREISNEENIKKKLSAAAVTDAVAAIAAADRMDITKNTK